MRAKDVIINTRQFVNHCALRVQIDRRFHGDVVETRIIKSKDVINMRVRKEDRINTPNAVSQCVLTMVRWTVDQNDPRRTRGIGELKHRADTRSAVAWISAGACGTIAGDHRDAGTGARAEQRESQIGDVGLRCCSCSGMSWNTCARTTLCAGIDHDASAPTSTSRSERTTRAGSCAPHTTELTATPWQPAACNSPIFAGVIPPIAKCGTRAHSARYARK